jgi:LPXTG-motif cell wall-anchored protein
MYRRLFVVSIVVLLLTLALASVSFAQTGTGSEDNQQNQGQTQNQGDNPGSAFNGLSQSSMNLNAGERDWYVFRYAGDNSPIQIRLSGTNAQFSVWTQSDIQNAQSNFGATANPVGRSSANTNFGGDQYWTGSFNAPGTYFIMVETTSGGQNTGNYTLSVTGSGVSWQGQQAAMQQGTTGTQQGQTGAQQGTSGQQAGGLAPQTLPTTGAASAMPLLIGGLGALAVATGALLRREK